MTAILLNSPRSESTAKGKIWFILYFHIFTKQQKTHRRQELSEVLRSKQITLKLRAIMGLLFHTCDKSLLV